MNISVNHTVQKTYPTFYKGIIYESGNGKIVICTKTSSDCDQFEGLCLCEDEKATGDIVYELGNNFYNGAWHKGHFHEFDGEIILKQKNKPQ